MKRKHQRATFTLHPEASRILQEATENSEYPKSTLISELIIRHLGNRRECLMSKAKYFARKLNEVQDQLKDLDELNGK